MRHVSIQRPTWDHGQQFTKTAGGKWQGVGQGFDTEHVWPLLCRKQAKKSRPSPEGGKFTFSEFFGRRM